MSIRVAQVGQSRPPTISDLWRTSEARDTLPAAARWRVQDEETINIAANGRDFLAESDTYDLVLVHSVLDPKWATPIREGGGPAAGQVSPLDSYDAWRDRLLATGARWIVIFEGSRAQDGSYESLPGCLNGWGIDLPGYRVRFGPGFTVFTKHTGKAGG